MLRLGQVATRNCQGVNRRELLRLGGLELAGLSLAGWLARQASAEGGPDRRTDASCIFIWLNGGPSQFETFDPKPRAPDAVRGPFGAIQTSVPGLAVCELLPMLARQMDRCAVIRSMTHTNANHSSTAMLAGFEGGDTSYGAVLTRFNPGPGSMPPYVHIGSRRGDGTREDSNIDHVGGGEFGDAFEPLVVRDPVASQVELPGFSPLVDVSADRFHDRRELLAAIDRWRSQVESDAALDQMRTHYRRAIEMLSSSRVREAFDVAREDDALRARYGANFFGQACLMARRLVEAGTRYVQIKWYDAIAFDAWDCHGAELPGMVRMEQQLCPRLDQGLSALLEDLHLRGMLESTLVVVAGEFGRTPTLNKFGARDHWPFCYSTLLAGGGVPGGAVVGSSNSKGEYPADRPVRPEEFAATLYRLLGLDTTRDLRIRRFIQDATPLAELA